MLTITRFLIAFAAMVMADRAAVATAQDTPSQDTPSGAAVSGAALYARNCALCHGLDLKGRDAGWQAGAPFVPPLDWTGKAWRMTDQEIGLMIVAGSHGRQMRFSDIAMPAFAAKMSDSEVSALLSYIKSHWTPTGLAHQREAMRRETMPQEAWADIGAQLYAAKCAVCHGGDLQGATYRLGSGATARDVRVPPLRVLIFSDRILLDIIRSGESKHPVPTSEYVMPNLMLGDEDARAILAFLRQRAARPVR